MKWVTHTPVSYTFHVCKLRGDSSSSISMLPGRTGKESVLRKMQITR